MEIIDCYFRELKKCEFYSKPDEWFVEGSKAILDALTCDYNENTKISECVGLFDGITNETYEGYTGKLPREDGEVCPFNEFFIYNESGNEISNLTIREFLMGL